MSFGKYPYGTTPWGGSAVQSGGITLVSASPAPDDTNVEADALVSLSLSAPAEFDPNSISLSFDGDAVIRYSEFVAPYTGTLTNLDGNPTAISITVNHPDFEDGAGIDVDFEAYDLAGALLSVTYTFHIEGGEVLAEDTLTLSESVSFGIRIPTLTETLVLNEYLSPFLAVVSETLTLTESALVQKEFVLDLPETLDLFESVQVGSFLPVPVNATQLRVDFPEEMRLDGVSDPKHFRFENTDGAVPVLVESTVPEFVVKQTGSQGQVISPVGAMTSKTFDSYTASFTPENIGDYLFITDSDDPNQRSFSPSDAYRIEAVSDSQVTVDRPLSAADRSNGVYVPGTGFVVGTGTLHWEHTGAVKSVLITHTEPTGGQTYNLSITNLKRKVSTASYSTKGSFVASASKPRVTSVQFLPNDGSVIITFNETMRVDAALLDPAEYTISGPTQVIVKEVSCHDSRTVLLRTNGFGSGSYTLTVNATGTPKDISGNPMDPSYNQAIFTGSVPTNARSVFTDKGPISKPELTIQSGTNGTIQTQAVTHIGTVTLNEMTLSGGSFSSIHVGKYLELSDTTVNSGQYQVVAVLSPTRLRLAANLRLPDAANGSISWRLFDPRHGEIADDPTDVVVRVNGVEVIPEAVIGLLGQIILPTTPAPTDDVKVSYSWFPDPTVEMRRLNSKEFKLNGWAQDSGRPTSTQHTYRYRNSLVSPSTFTPDDTLAEQAQPLLREISYRAFERAYTASLNDPSLLLLNTPQHRVAYPPMSRQIEEVSISYVGDSLPEADTVSPWVRKGIGLASVTSGLLTVQDNTGSPYPVGNPLFWVREADFTFPHVFALTWRMHVTSTTPVGVFTGVSAGWSNEEKVALVGYLIDGGVRKIGFLAKGSGNDPSQISGWIGGVSTAGAVAFDWSIPHTYRILRDRDGVIRLYVDGDVVETLRVTSDELPFLEELDDPFDQVQGVFFGSLSRQAMNVSVWDFVRYLVLPTNPEQSVPAIFTNYDGEVLPENSPAPWTPIGYHGNESIVGSNLIVDSTSATSETDVGLVGGDFRGYTRIEPLLQVSSDVVLDVGLQLRTYTHGITPNAVMAAVDDGSRLVQLSFFPTQSQPKYSYPGRSFPQDAMPNPWSALGGQTARMLGQTLVIEDTSTSDGLVYALVDSAPNGGLNRVLEATNDYYIECKFKIVSYTHDGSSERFCGFTVDTFDGTRTIGVMARETTAGVKRLAFHSDGLLLGPTAQFDFNWLDGITHVLRIVKNTSGNLVSLFVDGILIGTSPYTSFSMAAGNPTISFGSSTAASSGSLSVVEWYYVNTWRGQPASGVRKYAGIWKGFDNNSLTGYYLPTKCTGKAQVVGNTLTDTSVDFVAAGVSTGDDVIVDVGTNKGSYQVASVSSTVLTLSSVLVGPSEVDYRIAKQVDWTVPHKYRVVRDPGGAISLLIDAETAPAIRVEYNEINLPASTLGVPRALSGGLPSISWGAFDPENLSQVAWDFIRYGVTRSNASESRIVPHHQVLNQRNVMSSPVKKSVAHTRTGFSSSSTGIPFPWREYVDNPLVVPYTALNEGTPIVPKTQTYEVRRPTPQTTFVSGLNRPEDVLNGDGDFLLNDGATETKLLVPKDVLYDSLEVVERTGGDENYIAPFSDEMNPISLRKLSWVKEVCGTYSGDVVPEQDPNFGTPWVLESEDPGSVSATVFSGVLTYTAGSTGNTIYRNPTPLTDPVGLNTKVDFRLRVLNDSSSGTGDTGIRFGFSAFGTITAALAFVSTPFGDREVRLLDMATQTIVAAIAFDFLDGAFHTYRLKKNIDDGTVDFLIDP